MANTDSNASFSRTLPAEIRTMVWQATAGITVGPPRFICLEVDFMDGYTDAQGWHNGNHHPSAVNTTNARGHVATTGASHHEGVLTVGRSNREARNALRLLDSQLRKDQRRDLIEIRARFRQAPMGQGEFSVWVSASRDVLCLQSACKPHRIICLNGALIPCHNWFAMRQWSHLVRDTFYPLRLFGLDRMERVAVDWQFETGKGSIRLSCVRRVCETMRDAWFSAIYSMGGGTREYCVACMTAGLHNLNNSPIEDPMMANSMIWTYRLRELVRRAQAERTYPPDEPGTFVCLVCSHEFPAGEGRLIAESDWQHRRTGIVPPARFQPVCHQGHLPVYESDLETMLQGRLPALQRFYIIDNSIKMRQGTSLSLPAEQFEGHRCRFVEVNTNDPAWNLAPGGVPLYPPVVTPNDPAPFNSFAYAHYLQLIAFENAAFAQAKKSIDEHEAWKAQQADPDDSDSNPNNNAWNPPDHFAGVPRDRKPLNERVYYSSKHVRRLGRLARPQLIEEYKLVLTQAPDEIFPVKVKVMARLDD